MRRLAEWIGVGVLASAVVVACGDDPAKVPVVTPPGGGAGGDEPGSSQAGKAPQSSGGTGEPTPEGGSGGMPAGPIDTPAGAGGQAGEGGAPQPPSKDVRGRIMSGLLPRPDAVVRVNDTTVTSGADGSFVVEDAPDEYQLVVYIPELTFLSIYDGVSTRQPLVNLGRLDEPGEEQEAAIRGKVTGGLTTPFPQYTYTEAEYVSKTRGLVSRNSFDPPDEGFDLWAHWNDDTSDEDEGEIWIFQTISPPTGAIEYTGFGRRKVNKFTAGDIVGSLNGSPLTDVALTDPEELTLSGTLTLPVGHTIYQDKIIVGPWWTSALLEPGDYSMVFPKLDGVPNMISVDTDGPNNEGANMVWLAPTVGPWNLEIPPAPTLLTPTNDANSVTTQTAFTWGALPPETVAVITYSIGDWYIERATAATSTTIFDVSKLGVSLPAGAAGQWRVEAVGPGTTVEAVMVADDAYFNDGPLPRYFIHSQVRDFTTSP